MTPYSRLFMVGLTLSALLMAGAPALAADQPPSAPPLPLRAAPPRAEAPLKPGIVYADKVLQEDTVWRGEVLVEGVLTVAPQATLTVEPGTVVRFRRSGAQAPLLVVQGRLVATGAKDEPILFASSFAAPAPGDWQGIMLLGSEKKNQLEHCTIEGAQTGFDALFSTVTLKNVHAERCASGLRFQDTILFMEGGGASECDTGLLLTESEATLRAIAATGNRVGISAGKSSVYLYEGNLSGNREAGFSGEGCRVKIQGGTLSGNGNGATLLGCEGSLTGARLMKNREYGLSLTASRIRVSANQITGNGNNGVLVFDGAGAAWGNAIYENAGYDLYNAGGEEFRAPGNYWGAGVPKIFEKSDRGKVLSAPALAAPPSQPMQ